jgi:predicted metal-dependent phosphoesterase TrpH
MSDIDSTELINIIKSITKNSCPNSINFHMHSTFSDGSLTAKQIYYQAIELNIDHYAITDHHSVNAYIELSKINDSIYKERSNFPKLWTGIEITCLLKGCLVHVLGLGFDHNSKYLLPYVDHKAAIGNELLASTVVDSIHKANGIAVLAHPARYKLPFDLLINEASKLGFDAVETWYNYERAHNWIPSEFVCDKIFDCANSYSLLSTCGTDSHGLSLLRR